MPDRGEKYADKKLSQVDRQLRSTYASAQKELQKKLADFEKRHKANDERKRRERDEGKITEQQYRDWLSGQVFIREQWQSKIDQVCSVMLHHNEIATQIINESRFDTFAENYYAEAFRSQWIVQNISFNVYNTQALARLIKDNPQVLPEYEIDKKKDYKWNYKKVNNIIQQGIIQGESVDKIGERLCEGLAAQNENKMRMFARTAITGAQNAGRQVQMEQAADMGIEVNKRWIATPDNRTRDSHRAMDGEEVPYNEDFPNGLEYPGDPAGPPEEVYNCRCTMQTVYPKYEDRSKQWREDVEIDGVPYEEWKEGAKNASEYKRLNSEPQQPTTREKYEKKLSEYDRKIEKLREQRAKMFESGDYDKKKTDKMLERIFGLEDKRNEYIKSQNDDFGNLLGEKMKIKLSDGKEIAVKIGVENDYKFPDGRGGVHSVGKAYRYNLPNGTTMYYQAGLDKAKQDLSPEMLIRAYYDVPKEIRRLGQKAYTVVDYRNPEDAYWAVQYNDPKFRSYMTAGNIATVWQWKNHDYDYLVSSIAHEAGHKIDTDNGSISLSAEWADAKAKDKKHSGLDSPTDYAKKSNSEDFADSVKKLAEEKTYMRQNFPNRLDIIERTLKNGKPR